MKKINLFLGALILFSGFGFTVFAEDIVPVTPDPIPTPVITPVVVSMSPDVGVSGNHITNNNKPTFSGTAAPNTELKAHITETNFLETTIHIWSDNDGNWSLSYPNYEFEDGTYNLTVQNFDPPSFGAIPFQFTIDTVKPEIQRVLVNNETLIVNSFNSYYVGLITKNVVLNVLFTDTPVESKIIFWSMGSDLSGSGQAYYEQIGYSKSFTGQQELVYDLSDLNLPDGAYRVMVVASDSAGNTIDFGTDTFVFTIDTVVPVAPVIISPTSGPYSGNLSLDVSGTCDAGNNIHLSTKTFGFENNILGADSVPCSDEGTFTINIPSLALLNQGEEKLDFPIQISAVQVDNVGNVGTLSNTITISAPAIRRFGSVMPIKVEDTEKVVSTIVDSKKVELSNIEGDKETAISASTIPQKENIKLAQIIVETKIVKDATVNSFIDNTSNQTAQAINTGININSKMFAIILLMLIITFVSMKKF